MSKKKSSSKPNGGYAKTSGLKSQYAKGATLVRRPPRQPGR